MTPNEQDCHIEAYLAQLGNLRHLSTATIGSYRRDLQDLAKFAAALDPAPRLAELTHLQLRRFASQMHSRDLNPRSIARKLSAWRGFFGWLGEHAVITSNPVAGIKAPKQGKPLPKALSTDDAVRLVTQTTSDTLDDSPRLACDRAMFELLYSSGLRVSEMTSLDVRYAKTASHVSTGWVDLDAGEVTVTGKGNKMRTVPVGQAAVAALRDWIAVRLSLQPADPHALFLSARGTRISVRLVQLRLKARALQIGIPSNVHPHVLRHSFASHVLQSSGDLRAVQEMLGHASITSTQIYTSLDFQRLAQVYDAAHPRAKK